MTNTITEGWAYDPQRNALTFFFDGKPRGGVKGPVAERMFIKLLLMGGNNIHIHGTTTQHSRILEA